MPDEAPEARMPGTAGPPASLATEVAVLRAELEAERNLAAERRRHYKDALELQATEYERRLAALNGEAAQLKAMQSTYYPREMADKAIHDIFTRLEESNAKIIILVADVASLRERMSSSAESQTWLIRVVIGSVLVAAVAALFQVFGR